MPPSMPEPAAGRPATPRAGMPGQFDMPTSATGHQTSSGASAVSSHADATGSSDATGPEPRPPGTARPPAPPEDGALPARAPAASARTDPLTALVRGHEPKGDRRVRVVDGPETRVRHPSDLVTLIVCVAGIGLVLLACRFAQQTTAGVAHDVQGFYDILARVLFLPVTLLEGLVTLFIPASVLIELGIRRLGRQVVEAIAAAAVGFLLGITAQWAIREFTTDQMIAILSAWDGKQFTLTVPSYVAALCGMLTAAGTRTRRRTVAWSWNLLFITIGIMVVTAKVSLPGILIAVLLGRIAGLAVRYASGVRPDRAYGSDLIRAANRAGFPPTALIRVRDLDDPEQRIEAATDRVAEFTAGGDLIPSAKPSGSPSTTTSVWSKIPPDTWNGNADPSDSAAVALTRAGDNRVYALYADGVPRRDLVVLDGDRQVVGYLARFWRSLRLRGIERRGAMSLRSVAERTSLLSYAATAAGVRTPRLLGVGEAADSMALVTEHPTGARSLHDLPEEDLTDEVLQEIWRQLALAHAHGLAHRALTSDVVLVSGGERNGSLPGDDRGTSRSATSRPQVWLTGWEQGDIASSSFTRRMDLTQMVALLALRVGATRAVGSAVHALPEDDIAAIGPLLQSIVLPSHTREEMRRNKDLLKELRQALVVELPEADVEPQRVTRFGARTVISFALVVVAVTVLVTTLNLDEIVNAVKNANPWWALASFGLGLFTWLGAALTLMAFSPTKLSLWRTTLTQAAGSYVALAAPAGIGPAALNMRMLTKRGVGTAMSVATVALVQVAQFVTTIVVLVILAIFTGDSGLIHLPSKTVLLTIGGVATLIVALLLIPKLRGWVMAKIRPIISQVWPRLSQMLTQPGRLAMGLGGSILVTMGYVFAFEAALLAFGKPLSLVDAAIIYLVGNAAGAVVPTPGGVGTIEAALATGLRQTAGIPTGIAFSATMLFRVATYWLRIPIGLIAMRYLQRQGDL